MTNPTVPAAYSNVTHGAVILRLHVIIGAGSVLLPSVTLEEGAAVGALSVVRTDCSAFTIYAGNPARRIAERKRDLLEREQAYHVARTHFFWWRLSIPVSFLNPVPPV